MQMTTQAAARPVLVLSGRVDALSAGDLRERLDALLQETSWLLVDLSAVDFIDSAGLAALVKAMKTARTNGGDVQLVRPTDDAAYRVFELTRFDRIFVMHESGAE